jgi:hypothetical protein
MIHDTTFNVHSDARGGEPFKNLINFIPLFYDGNISTRQWREGKILYS